MPRLFRHLLALCVASVLAVGGFPSTPSVEVVDAADAPWTLPTVPPKCSTAKINTGDVAGCIVASQVGMPETRGWPEPPFPEPVPVGELPWVDLARGSSGPVVMLVQQALIANGASIIADGQFGPLTETAVKTYQTANGLPSTGIVDVATADLLGVHNSGTGAFPPSGWKWLGWGYNGSPILTQWEAQLASNQAAIGSLRAGQLRAFNAALPLFEGFLAEIQAKGYQIREGGTYVFRCTASTRKDCAGLTRSALSNHAYGLATDINTVANPLRTYYGINGNTACQTPMATDMPQWVVQVAEKWGLYWGGYGWSSGCTSPAQVKTSASRDPMHFEFNGSVAQAQAILNFNAGPGACIDVADVNGVVTERCYSRIEKPAATTRVVVTTNAPAGATAALVNITTAGAATNGYVTAEACTAMPVGTRAWSNGNARPGRAVAAAAVVPLDAQGRFCIYQSTALHTIVDVQGYFAPHAVAPNGNLYTPVTPVRTTDTRTLPFCTPAGVCDDTGPIPAGTEIVNTAASALDAVATLANITVVAPSVNGYVTADTCASLVPGLQARSTLNYATDTVANLAVVPSATTEQGVQFCTYSPNGVQEIIDVQGFFAPAAQGGLAYSPLAPSRLVDTRQCWTDPVTQVQRCALINSAGSIVRMRAPAGATAVLVNLTAVQATATGYVSAGACSALTPGPQAQSNLNAVIGSAVANVAVVPVDADGTFCAYMSSSMHLAVDLIGTFSAAGALRFTPITPVRVHDSRPPA
ncbi:MAG: peptidoglycan-binding protein [Actinomycetota bacterium]|nr:peptidoglycan-binding protein [Actinomycetota bacterium]